MKDFTAPEGFDGVSDKLAGGAAWFRNEEGATLRGEIQARIERKERPGEYFYRVKLSQACPVVRNKLPETAMPLQVVNIDEKYDLRPLASLPTDKRWEIFVQCLGKQDIGGGKSMWKFGVARREITEDQIPF